MFDLILLALRHMQAKLSRTILTTLSIVFGVAVVFGSNTVIPSLERSLEALTVVAGEPDMRIVSTASDGFAPRDLIQRASEAPEVEAVTQSFRRRLAVMLPGIPPDRQPQLDIIGIEPANAQSVYDFPLTEGRFFEDSDSHTVILTTSLAQALEASAGDTFPIITTEGPVDYQIIGVLDDHDIPSSRVFVTLDDARSIFDAPGEITSIDVNIAAGADRKTVEADLINRLGTRFRIENPSVADMSVAYASLNFFGMMALMVGGFLIFNTFQTVVAERRTEFSMLRAIGAERGQVIGMVMVESLLQGAIGTLGGLALGSVFSQQLLVFTDQYNLLPISGEIHLYIEPMVVGICVAMGMLTTLIAGFIPARAAGQVSPLEALRPIESGRQTIELRWQFAAGLLAIALSIALLFQDGNISIAAGFCMLGAGILIAPALTSPVSRIVAPLVRLVFPQGADVALGNILRQPARAAIIVSTVLMGFAVYTASSVLAYSMSDFFVRVFTESFTSDILILPAGGGDQYIQQGIVMGAGQSLFDKIAAMPEVSDITGIGRGQVSYRGTDLIVIGVEPDKEHLRPIFVHDNDKALALTALNTGRSALLSPRLAATHGFKVGDVIKIETSKNGTQHYTMAGISDDVDFGAGNDGLVISRKYLVEDFGVRDRVAFYVELADSATQEQGLQAVKAAVDDYPQFAVYDLSDYQKQSIENGNLVASIFVVLAFTVVAPAVIGLINTLNIAVLERRREFGMLRAIGGDRGHIQSVVYSEVMILGVLGLGLGLVAGITMGSSFVALWKNLASTSNGGLVTVIPWVDLAGAAVVGLVIALLASTFPAFSSARRQIVDSLRYE